MNTAVALHLSLTCDLMKITVYCRKEMLNGDLFKCEVVWYKDQLQRFSLKLSHSIPTTANMFCSYQSWFNFTNLTCAKSVCNNDICFNVEFQHSTSVIMFTCFYRGNSFCEIHILICICLTLCMWSKKRHFFYTKYSTTCFLNITIALKLIIVIIVVYVLEVYGWFYSFWFVCKPISGNLTTLIL